MAEKMEKIQLTCNFLLVQIHTFVGFFQHYCRVMLCFMFICVYNNWANYGEMFWKCAHMFVVVK